jgi:hypothetical protein
MSPGMLKSRSPVDGDGDGISGTGEADISFGPMIAAL